MVYGEGMQNNITKVAIVLCVDTSSSMSGKPIQELNRGIELFFKELYNDEIARYSAEVAIVEFNTKANTKLPFTAVDSVDEMQSDLEAHGYTALGAAVQIALNELDNKKREYQQDGLSYYQPWLILMSDGSPTDDYHAIAKEAHQRSEALKLLSIPIGIGSSADLDTLAKFSATVPALTLKDNNFKSFFKWLSASVSNQSRSSKENQLNLDHNQLDWLDQKS